jgi:RNA polymerase sigma-70 factor (ECF subfamily)
MPEKLNLKQLIEGCIKQKRASQKDLYKALYSYALGICMRYTDSKEEAQEVMNDGFMKVFQRIKKYDRQRPFKPWFTRVLINTAIDHFKKKEKYAFETPLDESVELGSEQTIEGNMAYEEILEMVRKLPPQYRAVFNLRAIEGYQHDEVAEILGISVGTSKSNYARAKAKLQHYLDVYFEIS